MSNRKTIRLSGSDFGKIVAHAKAGLPNEACGLLGGSISGDLVEVKQVYLLRNADKSKEHFSMDPREQLAAVKDMRSKGLVPLGNWHSHPETPSRPSAEDIRMAYDPNAIYMILSLESQQAPNLNAFHIQNGGYEWEILALYD
ncbi:MAG: M67 family metallopeptidase [Candidatus Onthomonas sp.]